MSEIPTENDIKENTIVIENGQNADEYLEGYHYFMYGPPIKDHKGRDIEACNN